MAAFSTADPAALDTAGEVIAEKFDIIQGVKKQIEDRWIEVNAQWKSRTADKYGEKVAAYCEKIQAQLEALNELRELMGQSALNYRATEEDVEAAVDAVDAAIND